jgi:hypothetical protein
MTMKLSMGWMISAGVIIAASTANAQVLPSYRIGAPDFSVASDIGDPYVAMPAYPARGYVPELLPPREVYAVMRDAGYSPLGSVRRRGPFYIVAAINMQGDDGRLVIDARTGRIVRFMPADLMDDGAVDDLSMGYGPQALLPPIRNFRTPPRPSASVPRLASRSLGAVPLPKEAPQRAMLQPKTVVEPKFEAKFEDKFEAKSDAESDAKPQAAQPAPVPAQQSAAVQTKTAEAPAVSAQAKPTLTLQPTQAMPAAQGLN